MIQIFIQKLKTQYREKNTSIWGSWTDQANGGYGTIATLSEIRTPSPQLRRVFTEELGDEYGGGLFFGDPGVPVYLEGATVNAPNADLSSNGNQIATTAFVKSITSEYSAVTEIAASEGDYTYPLQFVKPVVITGTLLPSVDCIFTLPTPIRGGTNQSIVKFYTGALGLPDLIYSGFTPVWLNGKAIATRINKSYTIVFEQDWNGSAWVVKASWGEY